MHACIRVRVCVHACAQGVVLAQQYQYPQMEQLLARYANTMLEKDKVMDAIELYRKVWPRAHRQAACAKRAASMAVQRHMRSAHPHSCWPCALCAPFFLPARYGSRQALQHRHRPTRGCCPLRPPS